jgi:hypothetical protein
MAISSATYKFVTRVTAEVPTLKVREDVEPSNRQHHVSALFLNEGVIPIDDPLRSCAVKELRVGLDANTRET